MPLPKHEAQSLADDYRGLFKTMLQCLIKDFNSHELIYLVALVLCET